MNSKLEERVERLEKLIKNEASRSRAKMNQEPADADLRALIDKTDRLLNKLVDFCDNTLEGDWAQKAYDLSEELLKYSNAHGDSAANDRVVKLAGALWKVYDAFIKPYHSVDNCWQPLEKLKRELDIDK